MDILSKVLEGVFSKENSVYFDPLWGNHGDKLIEMGSRKQLSLHGELAATDPRNADAIIVNGGGAMAPMWGGLEVLENHLQVGAAEVVVLPSSFWPLQALESLARIHGMGKAKLTIFAREVESYQRLNAAFGMSANVVLGHDMAFYLSVQDIEQLYAPRRSVNPFALVVERRDAEASTSIAPNSAWPVPFKQFVPTEIKRGVKRYTQGRTARRTLFADECIDDARQEGIENTDIVFIDVSQQSLVSFRRFLQLVCEAQVVYTTRLHVAILRHIMKKKCKLRPTGGEYRKNEGVFEHSMKASGFVELWNE